MKFAEFLRKRRLWVAGALAVCFGLVWWLRSSPAGSAVPSNAMEHGGRTASEKADRPNRLIREKSPYLLQHAYNPVDWYPWGNEAFEKARAEQKPIFLSIGYSTCHWCHVMERESFSDPTIAEIMNRHFVSIKVDREERPDVDRIYMAFVQATTGSGGWPMSVFLTPDRKPFYGGTYFPPDDHHGRPGFRNVLMTIAETWEKQRGKIAESADRLTEALEGQVNPSVGEPADLKEPVLENTYQRFQAAYDPAHGGFGSAPKFPRPVVFNFLLRYYARTGKRDALEMTLHTLRAMANGGIHDQIGGGFHRYSTGEVWHVPHFEKMLYDQAQLAIGFDEAYQITRVPSFSAIARDINEYVLRDMRDKQGGFYSAEDADSLFEQGKPEHGEGAFYVWEAKQIEEILGKDLAAVFNYHYGVEPSGNVPPQKDPQSEFKGKNILHVRHTLAETAKHFGKPERQVKELLATGRRKLFAARTTRPRPGLDDKVLTSWNGLMISALARSAQTLDEPRYLEAATAAAKFLENNLYNPGTGALQRRYRDGHVAVDGFLEDYAFLIQGLLDLYEASFDVRWLRWAIRLQETQDRLFWDSQAGGYFDTGGNDSTLLVRMRDDYDGAEPAANSVAAMNLLRLGQITDRKAWQEKAAKTFGAFAGRLGNSPQTMPQMVAALDFNLSKPKQIVIAGKPGAPDTRALLRLVHERFIPNKILLLADGGAGQRQIAEWLPFVKFMQPSGGRATAYICENYVCKLPSADPRVVARLLDSNASTRLAGTNP